MNKLKYGSFLLVYMLLMIAGSTLDSLIPEESYLSWLSISCYCFAGWTMAKLDSQVKEHEEKEEQKEEEQ